MESFNRSFGLHLLMLFCGPYGYLEMRKFFMTEMFLRRIYVLSSLIFWPLLMPLDVGQMLLENQGLLFFGKSLPSTSLSGMWMGHCKASLDQQLLVVCFMTLMVSFCVSFPVPLVLKTLILLHFLLLRKLWAFWSLDLKFGLQYWAFCLNPTLLLLFLGPLLMITFLRI